MSIAKRHLARKADGRTFDHAKAAERRATLQAAANDEAPSDEAAAPASPPKVSLAKKKRLRLLAGSVAAANDNTPAAPDQGERGAGYQEVMVALDADLRRLKDIMSVEGKIEAKREMIATYIPWVSAVLDADVAVQDEVAITVMIWLFDIGMADMGLDVAAWVLRHGIALPERFRRKAPTLIGEMVADAALAALKADKEPDLAALNRAIEMTADFDMPDEVRAKQFKARGLAMAGAAEEPTEAQLSVAGFVQQARAVALTDLRRARELHEKAGVAKDIERLERELKKEAQE